MDISQHSTLSLKEGLRRYWMRLILIVIFPALALEIMKIGLPPVVFIVLFFFVVWLAGVPNTRRWPYYQSQVPYWNLVLGVTMMGGALIAPLIISTLSRIWHL